jgi:hypothetical protein
MANTVTSLSYANTFGELMAVTNHLVNENNIMAAGDYTKDSGTIYLSESVKTALQSNGSVIIGKQLLVQGIGSSATIQNNLDVQGQGYFTNTTLSLSTTAVANIGTTLHVLGPGSALRVSNDSIFFGNTSTVFGTFTRTLQANNTVNTANASITGTTYTKVLQANNLVLTGVAVANSKVFTNELQANSSILTDVFQANSSTNTANASIYWTVYANMLQANTSTNTRTASITGTTFTNTLQANTNVLTNDLQSNNSVTTTTIQANTSVNTTTLSATSSVFGGVVQANVSSNTSNASIYWTVYANTVQANVLSNTQILTASEAAYVELLESNTFINTVTISATAEAYVNSLQANSFMNTADAFVTQTARINIVDANTGYIDTLFVDDGYIDVLQANSSVNTSVLSATNRLIANNITANVDFVGPTILISGTSFANILQANSHANTRTLSVTGTTFTNDLVANNTINAPTGIVNVLQANSVVNTANVTISEILYAPSAAGYLSTLETTGQLSVGGDFIINGTTVFNSNIFTISADVPSPVTSEFSVSRGPGNSNASIRWNESQSYFDMKDVNTDIFHRILTNQHLNNTLTSTNTLLVATANSVNTLNNLITTANNFLQSRLQSEITTVGSYANSAYSSQNTSGSYANSAYVHANASFAHANAAFASANNVAPQIQPAFSQANAAFVAANNATNTIRGTVGQISPTTGVVSLTSNNGLQIVATSANNLAISTSQDLRTTASPTFASLTLTAPLALAQGGTGSTSAAGALNALLPSGQVSGYVLTTGGPGNYYWAAGSGGSGGGATPGTTINSTRLSYVGDGSNTKYSTPTFNTETQLRAYINGVRQFESEYSSNTSNSTIIFSSAPASGDKVLIEVDGYILNPYYANNIAYTVNPIISGSANTIQLAIDGLASAAALKSGTTFTGDVVGLTMATTASNTSFATTAFVKNVLNDSSSTYSINTNGNAGTVTNGLYSSQTYSDPSWLSSLAASKLTGTIPSIVLGNSSIFIGTTSLALNRGTGSQTLNGVSIDGNAGTVGSLSVSAARNNVANRIVRTNADGVLETGYIDSFEGNEKNASSPQLVWGCNGSDNILRTYQTGSLSVSYSTTSGTANKTANNLTFSNAGDGGATSTTFDGSVSRTISYNSIGAPSTTGTNASGLWSIDISGTARTANAASSANSVANALTFSNAGSGTASGTTYNGSAARTISYNSIGAPSTTGTNATGTWEITSRNVVLNLNNDTNLNYQVLWGSANTVYGTAGIYVNPFSDALFCGGDITAFASDKRLKSNIQNITNALDKVQNINGVTYEWNDNVSDLGFNPRKKNDVGVIAQEIQAILPEAVDMAPFDRDVDGNSKSGEEYLTVKYEKIVPLLIEAIKELKAEVEELKGKLNDN